MAVSRVVHINSDVGEGIGNENQLIPSLSACNIACGAHAGNDALIQKTVNLAQQYQVQIGAHPSFPDKENFGRLVLHMEDAQLKESLYDQIEKVRRITREEGDILYHVKAHGALYNLAAKDAHYAQLFIDVVTQVDPNLIIYVPYNSVLADVAQGQIKYMVEGFADRQYESDYTLVSRSFEGAVITNKQHAFRQFHDMYFDKVISREGEKLPFSIDTICLHGDTANAVTTLKYIIRQLKDQGITLS